MTERLISQVPAAKLGFLRKFQVVALCKKVRNSEIRTALNFEPPLLRIERSQQGCFGHMTRMSQERLARQVLLATPKEPAQRLTKDQVT